ncbi:MAG: sodium:proton antiporter NhaD [Bacteroidetes bacterium]|nr:sodium:proton antiporter NhaD [Bacteroidota bacterium]
MATTILIIVFIIGYVAIAMEHPLKLNKAASAIITGVICWSIYILQSKTPESVTGELLHHLGDISSILFFLLGAMAIVELIDAHNGFELITSNLRTKRKSKLLFIIGVLTFFLSAVLDNLTTAIVMVSLCSKILKDKEDRLWFAGAIIIAANAGGCWSPLGDVTTTMLWIGGQVTAANIIMQLLLPSIGAFIFPVLYIMYRFRGKTLERMSISTTSDLEKREGKIILFSGVGLLLFVPFFKSITHLPPFMGMLLSLGIMWVITTRLHKRKEAGLAHRYTVAYALEKVDTPSILFFLGILLAVSALQSYGLLQELAVYLDHTLKNNYLIGTALGLLSSIVDNVPLVAAAQGMYPMESFPTDHAFWEFIALTCGTGGSIIIIGSAAGVAAMGIEQIEFMWYLKKICWLAILGFFSGIFVFMLQHAFMGESIMGIHP